MEHRYSTGRIIESLSKSECSLLQQNYYIFDYYDDVLKDIGKVTGIDFSKRIRTLGEIKQKLAETKKKIRIRLIRRIILLTILLAIAIGLLVFSPKIIKIIGLAHSRNFFLKRA